jgi:hypothetical protein
MSSVSFLKSRAKGLALQRVDAVEAGEGLNSGQSGEHLVDEHGVKEGLVVAGLELLSDDQHLVIVGSEPLGGL